LSLVGRALDEDAAWPPRIILQLTALNAQVWAQYQSSKRLSVLMSAELLETAAKALHQLLFVGEN
jgi:aspartokinase